MMPRASAAASGGGVGTPRERKVPHATGRAAAARTTARVTSARSAGGGALSAPAPEAHMQGVRGGDAPSVTLAPSAFTAALAW